MCELLVCGSLKGEGAVKTNYQWKQKYHGRLVTMVCVCHPVTPGICRHSQAVSVSNMARLLLCRKL